MKNLRYHSAIGALVASTATLAISALAAPAGAEDNIPIENLLKSGWQVAGYTSTLDNRSSLILFRHPTETYLVQCSTIHDVTRNPRTFSNCYELR